ncbi:hypothetical protein BDN71DRAFT_1500259 [Pleurotus eryngii]|uniref:Uncharacterized protein n=1 Tax=Pleurotus eryngii TaxID=5323 RepID=A0A9P6ABD3_PLEER|nr:hypothetical protein BDN71DRAFT_1500259 [Pleurotus eryngii]
MTPFPYQEDPYDSFFDSDTESEIEDEIENSETHSEAYTFNVQAYDEVSRKSEPFLSLGGRDDNGIWYSDTHRLLYPLQNYFDTMEVNLYNCNPYASRKSYTTSSLDRFGMPDLPVVLYTGSLHAVPGHEEYPMIDPIIDSPSSEALTRLAATIT